MADVFTVLAEGHRDVVQLLTELESLVGDADRPTPELVEHGGVLANRLVALESRHEAAEEQYFWPAVRTGVPGGGELAERAVGQESAAKELLARLDGMHPHDADFVGLIGEVARAGRAHISFEEDEVWPRLRAALPAHEAELLGRAVAAAAQLGPTRPHPHTPAKPALLKTAGVAVAAVDRLRDRLSGRET